MCILQQVNNAVNALSAYLQGWLGRNPSVQMTIMLNHPELGTLGISSPKGLRQFSEDKYIRAAFERVCTGGAPAVTADHGLETGGTSPAPEEPVAGQAAAFAIPTSYNKNTLYQAG